MTLTGQDVSAVSHVRRFPVGAGAADFRRQGVQLAQGDHERSRLSSCSAFLLIVAVLILDDRNVDRDSHRLLQVRQRAGCRRRSQCAARSSTIFFVAWWEGRQLPEIDLSMIAVLGALAAISGNGGLTNTATQRLLPRSRLGHGQARRRDSQRRRRAATSSCRTCGMVFPDHGRVGRAVSALVSICAARPVDGVDAGLLRRRGAAQHAVACSSCRAALQADRLGGRRHDGRRTARRGRTDSSASSSG